MVAESQERLKRSLHGKELLLRLFAYEDLGKKDYH